MAVLLLVDYVGFEPEGTWQHAGGMLQPEVASAAAEVESLLLRHQRKLFCLPRQKSFLVAIAFGAWYT